MSQSNSILSQLDALDALADLGAASVAQSDPVPAARSASAAPPAYMQPANDTVFALFTELNHDIELLKREQRMRALPPKNSNCTPHSRICGTRSKP